MSHPRRLFLDSDGVLMDFDRHYPARYGHDHKSIDESDMWKMISKEPGFFESMPPMQGAVEFFNSVRQFHPIVLTGAPSTEFYRACKEKILSIHKHFSEETLVIPVRGGKMKPALIQRPGDVLVDDWQKNIDLWVEHGGVGILHVDFETTRRKLSEIGFHPAPPLIKEIVS